MKADREVRCYSCCCRVVCLCMDLSTNIREQVEHGFAFVDREVVEDDCQVSLVETILDEYACFLLYITKIAKNSPGFRYKVRDLLFFILYHITFYCDWKIGKIGFQKNVKLYMFLLKSKNDSYFFNPCFCFFVRLIFLGGFASSS